MAKKATGWKSKLCPNCSGHGQVSQYSAGGADFEGAMECRDCNGTGTIWKSKRGVLASFPGGPFLGRESA